jgi:hypothetical protein
MKLYDVIRKEQLDHGTPLHEASPGAHVQPPEHHRPVRSNWKKIAIITGAIIFIALLYIVGMKFVHAKVTIAERRVPFALAGTQLELVHEKIAEKGRLAFQAMVVSTEITREVFGTQTTASSSKAKGNVVFFNEYSKTAKTIKSGTTLTSAEGKRYITQSTVTVPGFTMSGTTKKPGTSAAVPIIAAETGQSYNNNGTTFTVSGYGGATAKTFYARTAGVIKGGDAGAKHSVSDAEREQVVATLTAQLTERLKRETRAQIPADLITFPDLQFISIDSDAMVLSGESIRFPATLKGTMVSYLIPRDMLESAIAKIAMSDHRYRTVDIPTLADMKVQTLTPIPTDPSHVPDTITITATGEGTIITKVSSAQVQESLIGIPRTKFIEALANIPEIDNARYSLTPFWAPLFPNRARDIRIVVQ